MHITTSIRKACLTGGLLLCAAVAASAAEAAATDEIMNLREQIAQQRAQIEELRGRIEAQDKALERLAQGAPGRPSAVAPATQVASSGKSAAGASALVDQTKPGVVGLAELAKKADDTARNLGGFRFSGDFRYRLDMQARSGNAVAAPLQNVRGRYRLRLNVDKTLDPRFNFHMQLSTGPLNNAITNDQDMAALTAKHPFSIAEAYVDFHPTSKFSIRGGRMEEVFADNMRFLWDDDVRFNGFQQVLKLPVSDNSLGFTSVEFKAGEYLLSNPAVYVLPANSPFVSAGYQPGGKVRTANLFHPGVVLRGNLGSAWNQQIFGGVEVYRNPNQIQLASIAAGFPVVVSNGIGLQLSGPIGATGNATTQPGGALYSAPDFHIAHLGYRLERKGVKIGGREMPAWFDFQASRNAGASRLRDAFMASANLGAIKKRGDVRALYQFAIKDGNSLISQFTDDDLGTGSGVNIAVHAMRMDVGLTSFLQLQNLFFIQNQRRPNDPGNQFFVPLQRGANTTYRYLGQLAFTF